MIAALCCLLAVTPMMSSQEEKQLIQNIENNIEMIKFSYEGHSYVCFWVIPNPAASGWLHDPECKKCKGKK